VQHLDGKGALEQLRRLIQTHLKRCFQGGQLGAKVLELLEFGGVQVVNVASTTIMPRRKGHFECKQLALGFVDKLVAAKELEVYKAEQDVAQY
jgi:hypothetical protein